MLDNKWLVKKRWMLVIAFEVQNQTVEASMRFHWSSLKHNATLIHWWGVALKLLLLLTNSYFCYTLIIIRFVRINDRGPYIGTRELDLSYGAAKTIGLIQPGVDYVSINYL